MPKVIGSSTPGTCTIKLFTDVIKGFSALPDNIRLGWDGLPRTKTHYEYP
jgi:hypothetical protein